MRLILLVAMVLGAAATTSQAAYPASCNRATAGSAIASIHLRMKLFGPDLVPVEPADADQVICFDFTRDGRRDLAVTIASGGTAGDIGVVVFRATATGWRVALARDGYKLGLSRIGADIAISQPVYKKNDPNCCPTGGFDHVRLHWQESRFAVARTWHTASFRP